MDVKELRIGNWIKWDSGKEAKIEASEIATFNYPEFDAIPLDEEWLKRFGVGKDKENGVYWINSTVCIERNNISHDYWEVLCDCSEGFICINNDGLEYVHQLQNLYFALTGTELIIK